MSEETQKYANQRKSIWAEVSSSDEDEEKGLKAVQSPKVIRTDYHKNKDFLSFNSMCTNIVHRIFTTYDVVISC